MNLSSPSFDRHHHHHHYPDGVVVVVEKNTAAGSTRPLEEMDEEQGLVVQPHHHYSSSLVRVTDGGRLYAQQRHGSSVPPPQGHKKKGSDEKMDRVVTGANKSPVFVAKDKKRSWFLLRKKASSVVEDEATKPTRLDPACSEETEAPDKSSWFLRKKPSEGVVVVEDEATKSTQLDPACSEETDSPPWVRDYPDKTTTTTTTNPQQVVRFGKATVVCVRPELSPSERHACYWCPDDVHLFKKAAKRTSQELRLLNGTLLQGLERSGYIDAKYLALTTEEYDLEPLLSSPSSSPAVRALTAWSADPSSARGLEHWTARKHGSCRQEVKQECLEAVLEISRFHHRHRRHHRSGVPVEEEIAKQAREYSRASRILARWWGEADAAAAAAEQAVVLHRRASTGSDAVAFRKPPLLSKLPILSSMLQ